MSVEVGTVKYAVELDDSKVNSQADKTQSNLVSKFGTAAKKVGAAALEVSTAVVTTATAAVASITKEAVSAYSEFEQLQGGAELLFGDAYGKVITNANHAFSEVQMSINDYLQTANGYATGLKQALGGDEMAAADLTNRIITAQADIVAATGNTAENVQNAFAGVMKSNFQMLDNLGLGITPTKDGMQEVIDKMNEWNEAQGRATNYQMGNLADMESALVDYVEYVGMAGYAHNEAADTIQGSMAQAKAAWDNLLTAIGSGDLDFILDKIDEFVASAETFANQIIPVVEGALNGIVALISEMAPVIAEKLPGMITDALPGLLSAGAEAIEALAKGLVQAIPTMMPTVTDIILQLGQMIIQMAPDIIKCGIELIVQLALGLAQALPELIPVAVDAVITIVETLIDNIDMLVDAAIELIIALADGLIAALPKLIEKAPEIIIKLVEALVRNFPKIVNAGTDLVVKLIEGITKCWGQVIQTGADIITQVKSGFSQKIQDALTWGKDLISNFIQGMKNKFGDVKAALSDLGNLIADLIGFSEPKIGVLSHFHEFAPDMMELFSQGIDDNIGLVENSVENVSRTIAGSFTADVGYNFPDIAGYAADLTASMTASASTEIIVPVNINGREIARASAWYMNEQLAWEAR